LITTPRKEVESASLSISYPLAFHAKQRYCGEDFVSGDGGYSPVRRCEGPGTSGRLTDILDRLDLL